MSDEVKLQTNVTNHKGSNYYYYRARVPTDLVSHYGRAEVMFSLRTKDPREANTRATIERLKLDQEYAHIRAMKASSKRGDISDDELERIALIWSAEQLEEDEADRLEGLLLDDDFYEATLLDTSFLSSSTSEWLSRGNHEHITSIVDHELERHGITLDKNSQAYRKACSHFLKAGKRLSESLKLRNSGEIVDTPVIDRSPVKSKSEDTLEFLLNYWKLQANPALKTFNEAKKIIEKIAAQTEHMQASRVSKGDIVTYKDNLLSNGRSSGTIGRHLNLINAIFNLAVANDKLSSNPAKDVKAPLEKGKKKPRIPFSIEELKLIFASPIYTANHRPRGGAGEAAYWLPLISLWTGARLGEIGQLLVDDIAEDSGVKYIHITTEVGDEEDEDTPQKTLKNNSSKRRVPIHPELVRCGFLDYVSSMKDAGHSRLFPLLKSSPTRPLTAAFSQWFGNHKRKGLGITDKRKTFHSFRHGFKDACRECLIPIELHDKLTGHKSAASYSSSVGDGYGAENYPIKPLNTAMLMLRYEGLDLSHLYIK
ncbi:site-specific integrase [Methylotenera sp. L2L1]|uniref:site-specific integrase n=1 Tax=Methylotenera sp. L2L1 TaxID=1502770 RepID=UPI000A9A0F40|nr:site-specific integrase [Methylotenera sp. L2L1]